jgi:hypothetical protein
MTGNHTEKLYYQQGSSNETFLQALTIPKNEIKSLIEARNTVRNTIKEAFKHPNISMSQVQSGVITSISPKFKSQGSFVYGTQNTPCHPGQQIDLDDGVYLPMSLFSEYGRDKEMLRLFFAIVDKALRRLCTQKNWVYDDTQPKCGRIILSETAHLDTPLYAIPNPSFVAMNKAERAMESLDSLENRRHKKLDPECINLGTRKNGWIQSDPLIINEWFLNECHRIGGEGRLQRVCRYLKAWRDYTWKRKGPSSIALMICAVNAYPKDDKGRDDVALMAIVDTLPSQLLKVINPALGDDDPEEVVYEAHAHPEHKAVTKAIRFKELLQSAMKNTAQSKRDIIVDKRRIFGERLPDRPEWITLPKESRASVITTTPVLGQGRRDKDIPKEVKSASVKS